MTVAPLWGPVVAYTAAIFWLSSLPDVPAPPGPLTDKQAHALVYAGLTLVVARALARARWAALRPGLLVAAAALATIYGLTDELHQAFVPGRDASIADLAADGAGAAAAAAALGAWSIIRDRMRR